MNTTTKIFRGKTIKNGAQIILSNRLFVRSWELGIRIRYFVSHGPDLYFKFFNPTLILVIYFDDKPIAASSVFDGEIHIFVRKSYRRNGLATSLFNQSMEILHRKNPFTMMYGVKGSTDFYRKMKKLTAVRKEEKL